MGKCAGASSRRWSCCWWWRTTSKSRTTPPARTTIRGACSRFRSGSGGIGDMPAVRAKVGGATNRRSSTSRAGAKLTTLGDRRGVLAADAGDVRGVGSAKADGSSGATLPAGIGTSGGFADGNEPATAGGCGCGGAVVGMRNICRSASRGCPCWAVGLIEVVFLAVGLGVSSRCVLKVFRRC